MAQNPLDPSPALDHEPETLSVAPVTPSEVPTLAPPSGQVGYSPVAVGRVFGDYELLEEIARGGMGVVFRARQRSLNRLVAIKMILHGDLASADDLRRFHTEAEQAASLEHPNIVPIHDVGDLAGQHYFTMKLIEGGTLASQMPKLTKDPVAAVRLLATVAHAVHHAHQHGILHRDLKPGNILLDADGVPHVTDFGLAKRIEGDVALTQTGAILGTPSYMAPEQAQGRKVLTTAADVYSLGAILYELLTGRVPFHADTPLDTVMKVVEEDAPRPRQVNPRVPRDLETICLKCLEKDPARRYGSADSLARDLERWLVGEPIQARRASTPERLVKWARRRPTAATLVGLAVLAAIGMVLAGILHNVRLQDALAKAEEQRRRAEQQEAEAEANFQKARAAVDNMLTRAAEGRLANLSRMEAVRLELLQEALKFYQDFLEEKGTNPTIRQETALAYRRVADVSRLVKRLQKSEAAYRDAEALQVGLVKEFPNEGSHRNDLAITKVNLAGLLKSLGRVPEAQQLFQETVGLHQQLVKDFPQVPEYRQRLALDQHGLAQILESAKQLDAAEKGYREALAVQRKLLTEFPKNAAYLSDAGGTINSLAGLLRGKNQLADVRKLLDEALQLERASLKLDSGPTSSFTQLRSSYRALAEILQQQGDHAELTRLSGQLRKDSPQNPTDTYNAACYLARTVSLLEKDATIPEPGRQKRAQAVLGQVMNLLQEAVRRGYRDAAVAEKDADLVRLRDREDFKKLLVEMGRLPSLEKTRAGARDYQVVLEDFKAGEQELLKALGQAKTPEQQQAAFRQAPNPEVYAQRFLEVAEANPETPAALDALNWILENLDAPERSPLAARAVAQLTRDHVKDGKMLRTCQLLDRSSAQATEKLMRAILDQNPYQQTRGRACLGLARTLKLRADALEKRNDARAASLFKETEQLYDRVQSEFGKVKFAKSTLGALVQNEVFELRNLRVGMVAPEIDAEDLDGKRLRLGEHRGKVVLLSFWADWCGFCQQMYPQKREMLKRYAGKPFVVLGVNSDEDREAVKKVVATQQLNFPTWWDGGSTGRAIGRQWNVKGYPTLYVLDGKGVIRYKGVRGKAIDQAIDALLSEQVAAK